MGFCEFYEGNVLFEKLFWHYLCYGTILTPKISLRNNDNLIANEGNAENMIEAYVGHVVAEYS